MELKASHLDKKKPSSPAASGPTRPARDKIAKSSPRSRRVNRSTRADAFAAFSGEVLRELNPRGPLESVMAGHVAASAWRLKLASDRQAMRDSDPVGSPDRSDDAPGRPSPSAADRAARSMRDALESLDCVRASRSRYPVSVTAEPAESERGFDAIEPNEWPVVPFHLFEMAILDDSSFLEAEASVWRDRLVFDFEVSETSPVIRGTWITVGHIVSLIVDGQTWADILRSHPELTEEDVRVCVAYAVAQDQDEA